MKTKDRVKDGNIPDIIIDPSLDKYNNMILFPKQVKKAKETIDRIGLPDEKKKNRF